MTSDTLRAPASCKGCSPVLLLSPSCLLSAPAGQCRLAAVPEMGVPIGKAAKTEFLLVSLVYRARRGPPGEGVAEAVMEDQVGSGDSIISAAVCRSEAQ